MQAGERQVAPTVAGIRRDHVARYEWAARLLKSGSRVVDLACGIGYGTQLLAKAGHETLGIDLDGEALAYARKHYMDPKARYWRANGAQLKLGKFDAAVCFETIEHIANPLPMLQALHAAAPLLLASVPNEDVFPYRNYAFHHRHYTPAQFAQLLNAAGWNVVAWWGQEGPESEVEQNCMGRTIIAVAKRSIKPSKRAVKSPKPKLAMPTHVAILGLGPSINQYLEIIKRLGARAKFCDEVWAINALGDVFQCDRVFHMDDVRIQEIRAAAKPESNIAAMLAWLKRHPGPVYTSREHKDYPGLVEFPLEDVINSTHFSYLNNTAAYAVAYAIHLGVKKISLFGIDFTYPNAHDAEKGRGCVEFWLGMAAARGIKLSIPRASSLMDGIVDPAEKLYGYDTLDVSIQTDGAGRAKVTCTPRAQLPTAEEIEERYDHSAHPNPMVSESCR